METDDRKGDRMLRIAIWCAGIAVFGYAVAFAAKIMEIVTGG
jgi:hypothetical protein